MNQYPRRVILAKVRNHLLSYGRDVNPVLPFGRVGEVESEGLGIMALQPWAAQDVAITHAPD